MPVAAVQRILAAISILAVTASAVALAQGTPSIDLTPEERAWVAEHPVIRVGPDPAFAPVEWLDDNGELVGIAAEFLEVMAQRTGLRFEIVTLPSWDDVLEQARSRGIDMLSAATKTPQRSKYLLFTDPYVVIPAVIIVRDDVQQELELTQLQDMRLAVTSGYAEHDFIEGTYPGQFDLDPVPNIVTGLRKVAFGIDDAMIASVAVASYYIQQERITNLRVAGESGFSYRLAFATRSDWPELNGILEKGLRSISTTDRQAILDSWISLEQDIWVSVRKYAVHAAAGLGLVVIVIVLILNLALRGTVKRRTSQLRLELIERKRAEREVKETHAQLRSALDNMTDGIYMLDRELRYVLFNDRYKELMAFPTGVVREGNSIERAIRANAEREDYGPGGVEEHVASRMEALRSGGGPSKIELSIDGGARILEIRIAPVEGGGCVGILTDITERKTAEEELASKELQLSTALENMVGGMYMVDENLRFILFNSQAWDVISLTERDFQVGESIEGPIRALADRGYYGPGDVDAIVAKRMETLRNPERSWIEMSVEGGGRNLEFRSSPIKGGGVVVVYTDITDRKRTEAELARKENQLSTALDNMTDGIYMLDKELRFVLFNDRYEELVSIPKGIVGIGKPVEDVLRVHAERGDYGPGDPENLVAKRLKRLGSGKSSQVELSIDHGKRILDNRIAPLAGGGIVALSRDITKRKRAEQETQEQKRRADELLQVILPPYVVEELKNTNSVKPRRYDEVAILICDIVGFTPYCESHDPEEVVTNLGEMTESFEKITANYGLEKINSIGDQFMAACGLVDQFENPVANCVKCALEMVKSTPNLSAQWQVRIGVHVGPVVAGVVGRKKFLFGLWGDTINTTARAQSHADIGAVNVTKAAWEKISDICKGESLGSITVKGKGPMEMFRIDAF